MAVSKLTAHILILYAIVLVIGVFLLFSTPQQEDAWVCVQEICVDSEPAGDLWAQENCGEVESDGERMIACVLIIDGVEQLVPLDALNLSAIQTCTLYQCLQEMPVRATNYTFSP